MKTVLTIILILVFALNGNSQQQNNIGENAKQEAQNSANMIITNAFHRITVLIDSLPRIIANQRAKKRAEKINSTLCPDTLECKLDSIGEEILKAAKKYGIKSIAVWHFNDTVRNFGGIMADKLSIALVTVDIGDTFDIVERRDILTLLGEHKLNSDGLIDPETAKELGRLLSADAIVTGSLRFRSNTLYADIKMINTETGKTLWAKPYKILLPVSYSSMRSPLITTTSSGSYKYPLPPGYKYNGPTPQNIINSYMALLVIENQTSKPIIIYIDHKDENLRGYDRTTIINPGEKTDFNLYQGFFLIKIETQGTGATIHSSELILHTYDNIKLDVR